MTATAEQPPAPSSTCPRPGCTRRISRRMFACRADWFALSKPTRDAIWATVGTSGTERMGAVRDAMQEWGEP